MAHQPANKLRSFADLDDLFDTTTVEVILGWVNELAELKEKQRSWGKRHRARRKAFEAIATRLLDPDEIARVLEEVDEKMEETK